MIIAMFWLWVLVLSRFPERCESTYFVDVLLLLSIRVTFVVFAVLVSSTFLVVRKHFVEIPGGIYLFSFPAFFLYSASDLNTWVTIRQLSGHTCGAFHLHTSFLDTTCIAILG